MSILLLPLDDRPCTSIFPGKLAAIAGRRLVTPPRELLGNFLEPGNVPALLVWLASHAPRARRLLVSIDMAAYGGLVASRAAGISRGEAEERLQELRGILAESRRGDDTQRAWGFSVITRSSPTMPTPAMVRLGAELWKLSVLYHDIRSGKAGGAALRKALGALPPDVARAYFQARGRNHRVNMEMLSWVGEGTLDELLLGLDDSRTTGLNVLEREKLARMVFRGGLAEKVHVYPGADEMAMVLLARAILRDSNLVPRVHVAYTHEGSGSVVPLYEDRSLDDLVDAYLAVLGAERAGPETADIRFFCHAPARRQRESATQQLSPIPDRRAAAFAERIARACREGCRAAVADVAYANGADRTFVKALSKRVALPALLSYAAWNTAGNAVGTSLAHGLLRWASLITGTGGREGALAHARFLLERFLEDWLYLGVLRDGLHARVAASGGNPYQLGDARERAEKSAAEHFIPRARKFYDEHFLGFRDETGAALGALERLSFRLPWGRLFEAEIDAVPGGEGGITT